MSTKNSCPSGLKDILSQEWRQRERLARLIGEELELCGYNPIQTPLLEHYELFCEEKSYRDIETLCKFIDRSGRILTLRPDLTVPTARLAASNLLPCKKPVKLYYSGNVYRNSTNSTKLSELMQIGGEIFGDAGVYSDIESMINVCSAIAKAGLKDFRLYIGCTQLTKLIISKLSLTERDSKRLLLLIEEKNYVELDEFLEEKDYVGIGEFLQEKSLSKEEKERIRIIPKLFGSAIEVIEDMECLFQGDEYAPYVGRLKKVITILDDLGYGNMLYIDLAMPSSMGYYTGLTFCGYSQGVGSPIFSGGRYDGLFGSFGLKESAVGFAIYINTLMEALGETKIENETASIFYSEDNFLKCYGEAVKFRGEGKRVELIPIKGGEGEC